MTTVLTKPETGPEPLYRRRWAALGVLCLSLLIVVMANTSLLVAAPDMLEALNLTSGELQWIIDAYTVPYAALMLLMGAIGDKYGRREMLLLGLALFTGGAIMGAAVDSVELVIAARAVMGVAAAMVMPATLSLLVAIFPKRERAKAITAWTATNGVAIAGGPLLAGALLADHGWASTFLSNVPIALIAIVAALILVPRSKADITHRLDYVGGALSVTGLAALVYMIIEGPHSGWPTSAVVAGILAVGSLAGFVAWELRQENPMLDIRKFGNRAFAGANLAVLLFFLATFGAIYYITQHLQFVLGFDPLETGIRLLPLAGAVFLGAAVTGVLTPRLGVRVMVVAGMLLGVASLACMIAIDADSGYGAFIAPLMLLGGAIGLSVSPSTDTIMGSFPDRLLGVGGAVNDTSIELGGSLGIAILGSILAGTYATKTDLLADSGLPPEGVEAAQDSIGGAGIVADRLAEAGLPQQAAELLAVANDAFAQAVSHTSAITAVVLGIGTLVVAALLPGGKPEHRP